jgi:hypothetical protein
VQPAAAGPVLRCAARGAPVVVTTVARMPGGVSVAQWRDRAAVAWMDGPIGHVVVLDREGRPLAAEQLVNEAGSLAQPSVAAAEAGFVVTYVHKHGPAMQGCDMVGRTLGPDGALGAPVMIGSGVCSAMGYPRVGVRGAVVVVAATTGYEGQGLRLLRWSLADGSTELAGTPGSAPETGPLAVGVSPTGFVALWTEGTDRDAHRLRAQQLDSDGRPVGDPDDLRLAPDLAPVLIAGRPFAFRVRQGAIELRAAGASQRSAWTVVDLGARASHGAIAVQGGRAWAGIGLAGGSIRIVPLNEDGTPAGAASDLPAPDFAIDGADGAAVGFRPRSRELVFHSLACAPD